MHLNFTAVIGAKMMQSLVFMKKTFSWRKEQGKMQGSYENGIAEYLLPLQSIQSFSVLYSVSETVSEFAWSEINLCLLRLRYNIYSYLQGRWGQDASDFCKPVFGSKLSKDIKWVSGLFSDVKLQTTVTLRSIQQGHPFNAYSVTQLCFHTGSKT